MCMSAILQIQYPTISPIQQKQPIDELSARFVNEGLRYQFKVMFVLQSVATFNHSLPHNPVDHETLRCHVFFSTGLWTSGIYN